MDAHKKKAALRLFSNGMYVITSRHGERYGAATVTWVSQASFKPPLIMAAVRRDSNVFRCLAESRVAAVHILGHTQQDIAQKFFAPTRTDNGSLNGEPFVEGRTLAPILPRVPAYLECRVRQIAGEEGDHAVVILEVVEAEFREAARPLTIADSPWQYGG